MILWRFWLYFGAFIVFIGLGDFGYNDIIRLFAFIGTIILNLFLYEKTKHFQVKMIKLSLDMDFTIKQNKKVIEWGKYEKTSNIFIKILYLGNFIEIQNNELLKEIQKKKIYFLEISEKILKITEKIAKYQKILPIFFKKDYIKTINNLIFEEVQLLQNILQYSFQNQVKNHEKLISEIENLQNSEGENFFEILELQKVRLENQKYIFEKILEK